MFNWLHKIQNYDALLAERDQLIAERDEALKNAESCYKDMYKWYNKFERTNYIAKHWKYMHGEVLEKLNGTKGESEGVKQNHCATKPPRKKHVHLDYNHVRAIKALKGSLKHGEQTVLAKKLDVSDATIHSALYGKAYSNVKPMCDIKEAREVLGLD